MSSFVTRTTKTLIRLRGSTGWFESSLGALIRRYVFSRWISYDLEDDALILVNIVPDCVIRGLKLTSGLWYPNHTSAITILLYSYKCFACDILGAVTRMASVRLSIKDALLESSYDKNLSTAIIQTPFFSDRILSFSSGRDQESWFC